MESDIKMKKHILRCQYCKAEYGENSIGSILMDEDGITFCNYECYMNYLNSINYVEKMPISRAFQEIYGNDDL